MRFEHTVRVDAPRDRTWALFMDVPAVARCVPGAEQVTARGLNVVRVDPERNLILVRGSVPGATGGLIAVRPSKKTAKGKG